MEGRLDRIPISRVLSRFHASGSTGVVHLSQGETSKRVFFKNGAIVFASSDVEKERLGERLVEAGRLSRSDLDFACRVKGDTRLRLGRALVEMGLLSAHELNVSVKEQVESILYSLLPWRSGFFRTEVQDDPVDADLLRDDISTKTILLEGVRRIDDVEIIRRGLQDLEAPLVFAGTGSDRGREIELTAHEGFVLSRVDGVSSTADIVNLLSISREETLRCVYGLVIAGILHMKPAPKARHAPERVVTQASMAPPAPVPAVASAGIDDGVRVTYEKLKGDYARLEEMDHYEVLGVDERATAAEIKAAYFELAKELHPDRRSSLGVEDPGGALDQVFLRARSAYEIIGSESERRRYDFQRGKQRRNGAEGTASGSSSAGNEREMSPTPAPGTTAAYSPEELARIHFTKGRRFFKEAQYHEAVESFREAVRLDPSQAPYHVYLARTLTKNPRWRKQAEDHFRKALRIDRFNPDALTALGELYEAGGLRTRALRMYKEALGLDPGNAALEEKLAGLDRPESATGPARLRSLLVGARRV